MTDLLLLVTMSESPLRIVTVMDMLPLLLERPVVHCIRAPTINHMIRLL